MTKNTQRLLQTIFILLDLAVLNIGFLIAQAIFEEDTQSVAYMRYAQFWMIINGFWLFTAWIGEVYSAKTISFFSNFLRASLKSFLPWAGLAILYLILPRLIPLSAPLVLLTVAFFCVGLFINRYIFLLMRGWVKRNVYLKRKILILGYNSTARKFATHLEQEGLDFQVAGFIDDKKINDAPKYPVFPGVVDTLKIAKQLRVTEIYSTVMPEDNSRIYQLMQQADKDLIRFKLVADFDSFIDKPVFVEFFYKLPLLSVRREPLEDVVNRMVKRTFDVIVSGMVALTILWWLVPLLGLLIKLESPGPVFFVQLRSGKNNKPFRCLKFRSMGVNKDANSSQATKNDVRVTRIGKFIRKTSLDEFPQFWNVLRGEMSIVGPRPHMLKHTKSFAELADDYMIRQFLKPGITGWAQVNGYRGEIKELYYIKKRVEYDLWYLENWSIWLDLKIMFLTVYNVFKGEEMAY